MQSSSDAVEILELNCSFPINETNFRVCDHVYRIAEGTVQGLRVDNDVAEGEAARIEQLFDLC